MFKLIEIEFVNHPFFGSLQIKFTGEDEEKARNYTTLIIGPNGTGKSQILLAVINILNSLAESSNTKPKKYVFTYFYKLKLANSDAICKVDYNQDGLFINEQEFPYGTENLELPSKILVSAFSFNDKYPLRENRGKITHDNYYYLGLKSTTNSIFISNPPKEALKNLYNALLAEKDIVSIKEAFLTLSLKPELKVVYAPTRLSKFLQDDIFLGNSQLTPNDFLNHFNKYIESRKKVTEKPELKRLGDEAIDKVLSDEEKIKTVIEFLRDNIHEFVKYSNREITLKPSLNFNDTDSFKDFRDHIKAFQILSDLGLMTLKRFEIKKDDANFSFDDASSGEYHILLSYLNILSLIEDNSLILIDEPEISLHPNWQIRYMDIFNKVFHRFPNTHFIIATHSHFLVSDLESKNSNILGIYIDDGRIGIKRIEKDTFGWSAEQILLDIFEVATTRNYYLTRIIGDILHRLSQPDSNKETIKSDVLKLKILNLNNLNDNDPMKMVISKLLAKAEE